MVVLDGALGAVTAAGLPIRRGRPDGPDWWVLDRACQHLPEWARELEGRVGERRAAATFLVGWLLGAVAVPVAMPALVAGVVPAVAAGQVRLHRNPGGWFDGVGIDVVEARVGPVEEIAGEAGHVLVDVLAPTVAVAVETLPVGAPATWGGVADGIVSRLLTVVRAGGGDAPTAWRHAHLLLDAMAARVPLRRRPTPLDVPWSGGQAAHATRSTCCLSWRTFAAADRDHDGPAYCATCPLVPHAGRVRRLAAHLEATRSPA